MFCFLAADTEHNSPGNAWGCLHIQQIKLPVRSACHCSYTAFEKMCVPDGLSVLLQREFSCQARRYYGQVSHTERLVDEVIENGSGFTCILSLKGVNLNFLKK